MHRLLLLGLALAAALLLTACGSSNPKLIPQDRADSLNQAVDDVASRTDDEDCDGAEQALQRGAQPGQRAPAPRSTQALKRNITKWLNHIADEIPKDCKPESTPTPTPSATETPDGDADRDPDEDAHPEPDRHADGDRRRPRPPRRTPTVQPPDTGGVVPGRWTMADDLFADRYRLEHRLGVGGMSTVQLAFDTRLERYVAVKLLAEHLAEDASFVQRFKREALAAARLVHPNVVQVFDFGLDDETNRNFIVMEHVDGQSCAEILKEHGALDPRDAVDILEQACRGLDYAHRNGVVHRDVKPGNLLRSHEGVVKLADFGIAKAAEDSEITKAGSVLGTAAYLSPEQARGEQAGPPADLYALGVVSYQLLTGRLPYEAASLTDLARMQESGPPPQPQRRRPGHPARARRGRHARAAPAARGPLRGRAGDGRRAPAGPARDRPGADRRDDGARPDLGDPDARRADAAPAPRPARRSAPAAGSSRSTSRRAGAPPRRPRARPPRASARGRREAPQPAARHGRARDAARGVVVGVIAYQALQDGSNQAVQLKENIRGNVQDAVDQVKSLIDDNTR